MLHSEFATKLSCQYCGKNHRAYEWPVNGDLVPFFYQKKPGKFNLEVTCPHCNKKWFVVWDEDPGRIEGLAL
jgi:DNA-directed RNA polymerase subunit RPC12/RpoP